MSRRKQTVFEDWVAVAAILPWWLDVALALASYLGLHGVATMSNVLPTDVKAMGTFAGRQIWITFASIFQYLLPAVFLIGAGLSAFTQAKRKRLHATVASAPSRNALERMSWTEFETLVSETFRRRGFAVTERGGARADGGVDLELRLGSDLYLVQCKQWKTQRVGVGVVRELYGVMAAEKAVGGFVVASGDFTAEAKQFVEGRAIDLVATDTLLRLIEQTADPDIRKEPAPTSGSPLCPQCASRMVLRVARKGSKAGNRFWGCECFPACRGTRSAD